MKNLLCIFLLTLFPGVLLACEESFCTRINEIKVIPFRGEKVNDQVYNKLYEGGEDSLSCLTSQITNTEVMADPRKAPSHNGVTVGDVALFIISDILGKPINELIDDESFKNAYLSEGVQAYFDYVAKSDNRKTLKNSLTLKLTTKSTDQSNFKK